MWSPTVIARQGWLTFPVSLFLKEWVIRRVDCKCAVATAAACERTGAEVMAKKEAVLRRDQTSATDRGERRSATHGAAEPAVGGGAEVLP